MMNTLLTIMVHSKSKTSIDNQQLTESRLKSEASLMQYNFLRTPAKK